MSKVKVINNSLQVINVLVKEGTTNKNVQLLSKEDVILDKELVTDQMKRLKDLGIVSILPYTEVIEI